MHDDVRRPVKHAFKARIVSGNLEFDKDELLDVRWFTLGEIHEMNRGDKLRGAWVLDSIEHGANQRPLKPLA